MVNTAGFTAWFSLEITTAAAQNISDHVPSFFKNLPQFSIYYFDGRNSSVNRCVVDVLS